MVGVSGETRSVLAECAGITRGNVKPLSAFLDDRYFLEFTGMLIPGGFGAAKTLSTYAYEHAHFKVLPGKHTPRESSVWCGTTVETCERCVCMCMCVMVC